MTYKPVSYWKEQGKTYYQNFTYTPQFASQEYSLMNLLDTLDFRSVLELGCGFGRITRLISKDFPLIEDYVAVDISVDQLLNAVEICPDNIYFAHEDINEYEPGMKFDLVIAVEVLMHQLPSKVSRLVDKMIEWSNKYVVSVDYYDPNANNFELEPHNFMHDYPSLYDNKAIRWPIGNQSIFFLVKE